MPSGPKKRQAARRKRQLLQQHESSDRDSMGESVEDEDLYTPTPMPTTSDAPLSFHDDEKGERGSEVEECKVPESLDLWQHKHNTEEWVSTFDVGTPPQHTPTKLMNTGEYDDKTVEPQQMQEHKSTAAGCCGVIDWLLGRSA